MNHSVPTKPNMIAPKSLTQQMQEKAKLIITSSQQDILRIIKDIKDYYFRVGLFEIESCSREVGESVFRILVQSYTKTPSDPLKKFRKELLDFLFILNWSLTPEALKNEKVNNFFSFVSEGDLNEMYYSISIIKHTLEIVNKSDAALQIQTQIGSLLFPHLESRFKWLQVILPKIEYQLFSQFFFLFTIYSYYLRSVKTLHDRYATLLPIFQQFLLYQIPDVPNQDNGNAKLTFFNLKQHIFYYFLNEGAESIPIGKTSPDIIATFIQTINQLPKYYKTLCNEYYTIFISLLPRYTDSQIISQIMNHLNELVVPTNCSYEIETLSYISRLVIALANTLLQRPSFQYDNIRLFINYAYELVSEQNAIHKRIFLAKDIIHDIIKKIISPNQIQFQYFSQLFVILRTQFDTISYLSSNIADVHDDDSIDTISKYFYEMNSYFTLYIPVLQFLNLLIENFNDHISKKTLPLSLITTYDVDDLIETCVSALICLMKLKVKFSYFSKFNPVCKYEGKIYKGVKIYYQTCQKNETIYAKFSQILSKLSETISFNNTFFIDKIWEKFFNVYFLSKNVKRELTIMKNFSKNPQIFSSMLRTLFHISVKELHSVHYGLTVPRFGEALMSKFWHENVQINRESSQDETNKIIESAKQLVTSFQNNIYYIAAINEWTSYIEGVILYMWIVFKQTDILTENLIKSILSTNYPRLPNFIFYLNKYFQQTKPEDKEPFSSRPEVIEVILSQDTSIESIRLLTTMISEIKKYPHLRESPQYINSLIRSLSASSSSSYQTSLQKLIVDEIVQTPMDSFIQPQVSPSGIIHFGHLNIPVSLFFSSLVQTFTTSSTASYQLWELLKSSILSIFDSNNQSSNFEQNINHKNGEAEFFDKDTKFQTIQKCLKTVFSLISFDAYKFKVLFKHVLNERKDNIEVVAHFVVINFLVLPELIQPELIASTIKSKEIFKSFMNLVQEIIILNHYYRFSYHRFLIFIMHYIPKDFIDPFLFLHFTLQMVSTRTKSLAFPFPFNHHNFHFPQLACLSFKVQQIIEFAISIIPEDHSDSTFDPSIIKDLKDSKHVQESYDADNILHSTYFNLEFILENKLFSDSLWERVTAAEMLAQFLTEEKASNLIQKWIKDDVLSKSPFYLHPISLICTLYPNLTKLHLADFISIINKFQNSSIFEIKEYILPLTLPILKYNPELYHNFEWILQKALPETACYSYVCQIIQLIRDKCDSPLKENIQKSCKNAFVYAFSENPSISNETIKIFAEEFNRQDLISSTSKLVSSNIQKLAFPPILQKTISNGNYEQVMTGLINYLRCFPLEITNDVLLYFNKIIDGVPDDLGIKFLQSYLLICNTKLNDSSNILSHSNSNTNEVDSSKSNSSINAERNKWKQTEDFLISALSLKNAFINNIRIKLLSQSFLEQNQNSLTLMLIATAIPSSSYFNKSLDYIPKYIATSLVTLINDPIYENYKSKFYHIFYYVLNNPEIFRPYYFSLLYASLQSLLSSVIFFCQKLTNYFEADDEIIDWAAFLTDDRYKPNFNRKQLEIFIFRFLVPYLSFKSHSKECEKYLKLFKENFDFIYYLLLLRELQNRIHYSVTGEECYQYYNESKDSECKQIVQDIWAFSNTSDRWDELSNSFFETFSPSLSIYQYNVCKHLVFPKTANLEHFINNYIKTIFRYMKIPSVVSVLWLILNRNIHVFLNQQCFWDLIRLQFLHLRPVLKLSTINYYQMFESLSSFFCASQQEPKRDLVSIFFFVHICIYIMKTLCSQPTNLQKPVMKLIFKISRVYGTQLHIGSEYWMTLIQRFESQARAGQTSIDQNRRQDPEIVSRTSDALFNLTCHSIVKNAIYKEETALDRLVDHLFDSAVRRAQWQIPMYGLELILQTGTRFRETVCLKYEKLLDNLKLRFFSLIWNNETKPENRIKIHLPLFKKSYMNKLEMKDEEKILFETALLTIFSSPYEEPFRKLIIDLSQGLEHDVKNSFIHETKFLIKCISTLLDMPYLSKTALQRLENILLRPKIHFEVMKNLRQFPFAQKTNLDFKNPDIINFLSEIEERIKIKAEANSISTLSSYAHIDSSLLFQYGLSSEIPFQLPNKERAMLYFHFCVPHQNESIVSPPIREDLSQFLFDSHETGIQKLISESISHYQYRATFNFIKQNPNFTTKSALDVIGVNPLFSEYHYRHFIKSSFLDQENPDLIANEIDHIITEITRQPIDIFSDLFAKYIILSSLHSIRHFLKENKEGETPFNKVLSPLFSPEAHNIFERERKDVSELYFMKKNIPLKNNEDPHLKAKLLSLQLHGIDPRTEPQPLEYVIDEIQLEKPAYRTLLISAGTRIRDKEWAPILSKIINSLLNISPIDPLPILLSYYLEKNNNISFSSRKVVNFQYGPIFNPNHPAFTIQDGNTPKEIRAYNSFKIFLNYIILNFGTRAKLFHNIECQLLQILEGKKAKNEIQNLQSYHEMKEELIYTGINRSIDGIRLPLIEKEVKALFVQDIVLLEGSRGVHFSILGNDGHVYDYVLSHFPLLEPNVSLLSIALNTLLKKNPDTVLRSQILPIIHSISIPFNTDFYLTLTPAKAMIPEPVYATLIQALTSNSSSFNEVKEDPFFVKQSCLKRTFIEWYSIFSSRVAAYQMVRFFTNSPSLCPLDVYIDLKKALILSPFRMENNSSSNFCLRLTGRLGANMFANVFRGGLISVAQCIDFHMDEAKLFMISLLDFSEKEIDVLYKTVKNYSVAQDFEHGITEIDNLIKTSVESTNRCQELVQIPWL